MLYQQLALCIYTNIDIQKEKWFNHTEVFFLNNKYVLNYYFFLISNHTIY